MDKGNHMSTQIKTYTKVEIQKSQDEIEGLLIASTQPSSPKRLYLYFINLNMHLQLSDE